MIKSKVMFAVHRAADGVSEVGAVSLGAWPLAFSDVSWPPESYEDLDGFWSLWEAVENPEDFGTCAFGEGDLGGPSPDETGWGGIWVYEVEWEPGDVYNLDNDPADPDFWQHLHGGDFRRPTAAELSAVVGGHKQDWKVVL